MTGKSLFRYFVIFSIVFCLFAAVAHAQEMRTIPEIGLKLKKPHEVGQKPMYTYIDGVKTELKQDFGFVAIIFEKGKIPREQRHEYYKKVRLVISELNEKTLMDRGIIVLRLMPGATREKWDVFTEYMRRDKEVAWIGRVFRKDKQNRLYDLIVSTRKLRVTPANTAGSQKLSGIENFPLTFLEKNEKGESICLVNEAAVDTIDLVNRMSETGRFKTVSPVFIEVEGKPLSAEKSRQIMEGWKDSAPEAVKNQVEKEGRKNSGGE